MGKAVNHTRRLLTSWEQYRWLAAQAKPHIPQLTMLIVFRIAAALFGVWLITVTRVISSIAIGEVAASLLIWIGIFVGISLVNLLLSSLGAIIKVSVQEKFDFSIRKDVFGKLLNGGWLDVSAYHTGDLHTRLTSDVSTVTGSVVSILPDLISLITTFIAAFFSLYRESAILAFATVFLVPVIIITTRIVGQRLKHIQKKAQEAEGRYRSFTQESLANLAIVKSFSLQEQSIEKLAQLHEDRFYWFKRRNLLSLIVGGIFSIGYLAGYTIALAFGAALVMAGTISLPVMMQFALLVSMIQAPIIGLTRTIPQVITVIASVERLMELEVIPGENHGEIPDAPLGVELVLDNVGFSYTEGEPVLQACDMHLRPGDTAALTGLSGVGKTTLVRMLLLLIEPDLGKMTIRTTDGSEQKHNPALREWIAYVPQGNTLFSGTIADNLRIGKADASEKEMWDALSAADAFNFAEKLPNQLKTVIGEKGLGLSEGQAQRIAIARALIRNCPIIILDEATSALDEKTECRVLEGINNRTKDAACLIITHRSSALQYCNRLFEMHDGILREAEPYVQKEVKN